MPIETVCPSCGRKLRVEDEHAGKQARCPVCSTIYQVAGASVESAPPPAKAEWRMRTPEGQTYGPVTKSDLDQWVSEGRITADCQISSDTQVTWEPADSVYPVLREVLHSPPQRTPTPSSPAPARTESGERPRSQRAGGRNQYRYTATHRGGLILALAIISWAVGCPVFGIFAWVMGSNDLREMRMGRMDPSGMGLTQAGQVIGMIHTLLLLVAMVVGILFLLASVAIR